MFNITVILRFINQTYKIMRKILIALIISSLFIIKASAQDQEGLFSVSGNLSYGTEIKSLGIGLRGQYGFTPNIRGAAEYKYYIDRNLQSAWEINTDVHYVFGSKDELVFYPLAGLKFYRWTWDSGRSSVDLPEVEKYSHSRLGLNLGFGSQIALAEKVFIQPELRYEIIKDHSQFVAMCGITYQF